jgi:hypothetical protein
MIKYDVLVNGEKKETIDPCCQGICEIFEWGNDKLKEMRKKYNTDNIELERKFV